jgi:hypothetical protein
LRLVDGADTSEVYDRDFGTHWVISHRILEQPTGVELMRKESRENRETDIYTTFKHTDHKSIL